MPATTTASAANTRKRPLGIDPGNIIDGRRTKRRREDSEHFDDNDDGDDASANDVKTSGMTLWNAVKNFRDSSDRVLSYDFLKLPSKKQYPDYYTLIKRPVALDDIKSKIQSGYYDSLEDVKRDLDTCFKNARKYNMKDSPIWLDAKALQKVVATEYASLTGEDDLDDVEDEDGDVEIEDDDDDASDDEKGKKKGKSRPLTLQRALRSRLQKLVKKSDENGRLLSDIFMELPPKKRYPDYYKLIKRPICFDQIFKKIKRKEYMSAVEFAADVELVFSNAMTYNEDGSIVYEDAVVLKDYFKLVMSDLPPQFAQPATAAPTAPTIKLKVPAIAAPAPSPPAPTNPTAVRLPQQPAATASPQHPPPPVAQPAPQRQLVPPPVASIQAHQSRTHSPAVPPSVPTPPVPPVQAKQFSNSPAPNGVTKHPLKSVEIRTRPLGRVLRLDHRDAVRTWTVRLAGGDREKGCVITEVEFLEVESDSEEEEEEEEEEEVKPTKKAKKPAVNGKTKKASEDAMEVDDDKVEVQVKLNSTVIPTKEGYAVPRWEMDLSKGTNILEVGDVHGQKWKVLMERT